jgi:hypothetical protein
MFHIQPSGIVIIDRDTMLITDVKPRHGGILERDAKALLGRSLVASARDGAAAYESFVDPDTNGGFHPDSRSRSGTRTRGSSCRMSAVSFDLDESRRILVSVADVTEQDRLREALVRKQKVETIGILAGGIAHDFNNILAVILGTSGRQDAETDQPCVRRSRRPRGLPARPGDDRSCSRSRAAGSRSSMSATRAGS